MATHSSVLAWRIPGMGEPGGLPSMGSHRVGYDLSDSAAAAALWGKNFHLSLTQPECLYIYIIKSHISLLQETSLSARLTLELIKSLVIFASPAVSVPALLAGPRK